ncbi:aminopeptidase N [Thiomicrospira sp. XS5]|uniref:aminopeptidase N n=1 Tax=Thiomicrospira sp. XS5 TaxID=1775636 RepID=UPI000746D52A|nr:aminopeptidase N [Thiomicrospira sp. XS5]KUJ75517.1 aminopeptidase N [Thiomicrospira sp. XS5]
MTQNLPKTHYLTDYQAPAFDVESIFLTFELSPNATRVTNRMRVRRTGDAATAFVLDGEGLELMHIDLDGVALMPTQYEMTETQLILSEVPESFELEVVTEVDPENNTRLEGLYRTSGNYCTQCEAEGFRRITYYFDRPDVLTYFTTKIIADKADNKVLLSNGNLVEVGDLPNNRHYAIWKDPYKKPCYLFALVAGNLEEVEDTFITRDQRQIDLRIYVEPKNLDKCDHAMESLKRSMKWDEERFGLVYDLDIYMIVAVDDFNMGAMENKGLNVFNSKYVLARPETATDMDYEGIESVIGHEYFHNWTGNRVTCRDWFQLTLKEGLTVFRDQEFTSDMLSPAVKRIEDVKRLRSNQFPEDAGPMSHPIQPQSYIEMNNFYTMTVYEKGAEVVRLYHTLLGEAGFQKGMKRYIERFDGQAVTVEDFRDAMGKANNVDLSQMHNWYTQAGTPTLKVEKHFDAASGTLTLHCEQSLKSQAAHAPLLIPVLFGFLDDSGAGLPVRPGENSRHKVFETEKGHLLKITELSESFEFTGLSQAPHLSLLRHFSAPVNLDYVASDDELMMLASHDSDSFVRWESIQTLALQNIKDNVARFQAGDDMAFSAHYQQAFKAVLEAPGLDPALKALAIGLPDVPYVFEQFESIDVDGVLQALEYQKHQIGQRFRSALETTYTALQSDKDYCYDEHDIADRMLKNQCLMYLAYGDEPVEALVAQYQKQQNMTDVLAALNALNHLDVPERADCLSDFYQRWHKDSLVMDKWFSLQARSESNQALQVVRGLLAHPDFNYRNPNRVRSVLGVFGRLNMKAFHDASGGGYDLLAEEVLKMDKINPQVAARLVTAFTAWKRFKGHRQAKMHAALQGIAADKTLSKDVYEIVSTSLE